MNEIVEVEEVEDESRYTPAQVSIFTSTDPQSQLEEAQARARVLVQLVEDQGLATTFGREGSRAHVQVEGWLFLAAMFGLMPSIEWTRPLEAGGWEARATLSRLSDGMQVAAAEGECRTAEANWAGRDSFAVRSMAQTRATGKVCRIALSSVMVLGGFSGTPTEEMLPVETSTPLSPDEPHCPGCLAVNGELVAVTGPHDRQPHWRCTKRGTECGTPREYKGKVYSWSGWLPDFTDTLEDWKSQNPQYAGPMEKSLSDRRDQLPYILDELKAILVTDVEDDVRAYLKAAMRTMLQTPTIPWEPETALGEPILTMDTVTDEMLRRILANLTNAEADVIIAATLEEVGPIPDASHST